MGVIYGLFVNFLRAKKITVSFFACMTKLNPINLYPVLRCRSLCINSWATHQTSRYLWVLCTDLRLRRSPFHQTYTIEQGFQIIIPYTAYPLYRAINVAASSL